MSATKGYRAAFTCHDADQSMVTVVHFLASLGGAPPNDLSNALKTGAFPTALGKTLRTSGAFDSVTVTQIMSFGDPTPPAQDTQAMTLAGGLAGAATDLPKDVCGIVKLKTNVAGRGTKGWIYGYPTITAASIVPSTGLLTGAYLTALTAEATALNGVLTVTAAADTYALAVFSRARWSRNETNFLFTVTTCVAGTKFHYLRRRGIAGT